MSRDRSILYPALVTAAVAVTIVSAVAVAAYTGVFPKSLSGRGPAEAVTPQSAPEKSTPATTPRSSPGGNSRRTRLA